MTRTAAAPAAPFVATFAAALAAALTWLAAPGASAQGAVYRCGATYAQSPCADGREVDVADPRSAEQVEQARRVAADDRRLAGEMRRERLAEPVAHGGPSNLGPVATALPVKPAAPTHPRTKRSAAKQPTTVDFVALDTRRAAKPKTRRQR